MVWVDTWFDGEQSFRSAHDLPPPPTSASMSRKVLADEPSIVFTISPESTFDFYRLWIDSGLRLVSLPLACDATRYHRDASLRPEFIGVELAFVGGYWPYKARQFDRYLRRYEDRLTVFGYTRWPYARYGGPLALEHEPALYQQARVSPSINEPHVEIMGVDINERVFKVLGSGGVSVTDAVPGYREWFSEDELLVPRTVAEFDAYVDLLLRSPEVRDSFADRGYRAVHERHTYAHRAAAVMRELGLSPEPALQHTPDS